MIAMHRALAAITRGFATGIALGLALLLSLFATPGASAQGTFGTLPNPMTSRELDEYATRLKLSDQQKKAAEALHDQYKQEFRTLRNGEIADFLKDMRNMDRGGGMPKRSEIESFLKRMDQLNNKIAAIDSRLFDQMQAVLTDEQQVWLPRVRMARQRARYMDSQIMWISGNRAVDLSQVVIGIELTPDEFQSADPLMSQYETKLTSTMSKMYDAVTNLFRDMFDSMEKQGLTDKSMEDPEAAQKVMEAMQNSWRDITRKVNVIAADINELNHRTSKSVAAVLQPETARTFRNRFYDRAYPEASLGGSETDTFFQTVLKREDLSDDQRQAVTTVRDEYRNKADRLVEEAVTVIDKQRIDASPFDFNSEDMQKYQQKLQDLRTRAGEIRQSTAQALQTALGPDISKQLNLQALQSGASPEAMDKMQLEAAVAAKAAAAAEAAQPDAEGGDQDESPGAGQQMAWGADQFLPPRISRGELADYVRRLHLADDQKTVLQQLYKTYLEAFKVVSDSEIAALVKAVQSMWSYDQETQQATGPTPEKIEEIYRLRKAAIAAVHRADTSFLDDVEFAVLKPEQASLMQRVRLARDRQTYNRNQNTGYFYGGGSNESGMDLTTLIPVLKLNDATLSSIDGQMATYEQAITPAFATKFDASLDMQRAQERFQAEVTRLQNERGNPMEYQKIYKDIMGDAATRVSAASKEIGKINREALDALIASLATEASYTLRNEFNRRAYPNIYNDGTGVDRHLNEALKLTDINDEQRRKLNDLASEYRPAYASFCDQMVQSTAGRDATNFMMGDPEQMKEFQDRQEVMAKLRFDRNELNTRAISQLKSILTEDQIHRIGGLPEPKDHNDLQMWD